jgi:hypothetical protein
MIPAIEARPGATMRLKQASGGLMLLAVDAIDSGANDVVQMVQFAP